MSKKDKHKLYHVLVLDRSGSMQNVKKDTIGGFNQNIDSMINDQRDEIEQYVCLATFANHVQMSIWKEPLESVEKLDGSSYRPSGGTALYDAIGLSITKLREDIGDEIEDEKANVIVTIFSDGDENSSKEWRDFGKLKSLMDELTDSRMWTFTFIGCDEGSLETARNLGISQGNTMRFDAGSEGTQKAFLGLAKARCNFTSSLAQNSSLSGAERASAMDDLKQVDFFLQEEDSE
jgi:uncharacterized protein YegL